MEYKNETIRRQDRLLDKENAYQLLQAGEYGVLSMCTKEGSAYGIPVNFVWDTQSSIYIHCAPEGRKLTCIGHCPDVSFCVVGKTQIISYQFSTEYESIVLKCCAHIGLDTDERMHALELLLQKYSPDDMITGKKYAEKSFHRTEIIRLDIEEISGKSKQITNVSCSV